MRERSFVLNVVIICGLTRVVYQKKLYANVILPFLNIYLLLIVLNVIMDSPVIPVINTTL